MTRRGKRERRAGAVRAQAVDARAGAEGPHGAPQAGRQPACSRDKGRRAFVRRSESRLRSLQLQPPKKARGHATRIVPRLPRFIGRLFHGAWLPAIHHIDDRLGAVAPGRQDALEPFPIIWNQLGAGEPTAGGVSAIPYDRETL